MKKNIISLSTICFCVFIPFFAVRAEMIHFSGDHDVVVGKGQRKELKSSNSNINVILTDGMAVKKASSSDVLRGIYFNGKQKKASTLTHKFHISDPIKVSLKIYPTGGEYRYQTLMHLGSCELRYDIKKRVLKMISYLDNKTYQSIEMPCEMNKWSDIIFEIKHGISKMMINQSSEEIQFLDGSQLKQMKSMHIRFGLANNNNRLYQGYMDDITLDI